MIHYSASLLKKETVAHDTYSFLFEKPDGFHFQAGQFVKMIVPEAVDLEPKKGSRSMSISSAPSEPRLVFTMRRGLSPFKKILESMPTGQSIQISEPRGQLILPTEKSETLVFLAAGVGITPFRSMIIETINANLNHNIFLFYSDKNPDSMCFHQELQNMSHPKFHFIPTFIRLPEAEKPNHQETGRINWTMITKYVPDPLTPRYYIVGVPQMVIDSQKMLLNQGINMKRIHFELFTGY